MTKLVSILPHSGVSDQLELLDMIGILPVIDRGLGETRGCDIERVVVDIREVSDPDLFRPHDAGRPLTLETLRTNRPEKVRVVISPACWLDIGPAVDPLRLQAFLTAYKRMLPDMAPQTATFVWSRAVLDESAIAWAPDVHLAEVVRLWSRIVDPRLSLEPIEMATTARVYGNKVRLAPAIGSLVRTYLPDGARVADLMCGSGIVSRVLSSSFEVVANDVNPWAASLARLQLQDIERSVVEQFIGELAGRYAANFKAGAAVVADELRAEAAFLYGPVDTAAVERYREFCATPLYQSNARLAEIMAGEPGVNSGGPALLTTALFGNAYFGVRQSLAIDSIRSAVADESKPELREGWLGCLLLAATVCGSGPHFAQPPKIHAERAMRELLEHRSRDVLTEFTQLLRLLAERPVRARMRTSVLCGDWKHALASLTADGRPPLRAAYIDPPYTRLQYARYYHVLNTLIDYRFSTPIGVGRYAIKEMRPSSRFDGRERSARAELDALLSSVAHHGLVTFLSYSSSGMVSLPELCRAMEERFRQVDAFTVPVRHHSQGRRTEHRGRVDEFVLVGIP